MAGNESADDASSCSSDFCNDPSSPVRTPQRHLHPTDAKMHAGLSHERGSPVATASYSRREFPSEGSLQRKEQRGVRCHQLQLMRDTASALFQTLGRDVTRCINSDAQRLAETVEQLQPKADAIRKLVEEAEEMRENARGFARKRQQNLHLIERLKEEDKAIDKELQELPEKLHSLDAFREEERASLEAARAEYRLVQKQREHALLAWEEKIRVYEKALGIRIHQDDAGGPTLIRFPGLLPELSRRDASYGEDRGADQETSHDECFFAFQLDEQGAVSDSHCWPPVESYDDIMEAFSREEISLPIVVACMRRSFKEWRRPRQIIPSRSRPGTRRKPPFADELPRGRENVLANEEPFRRGVPTQRLEPQAGNRDAADSAAHASRKQEHSAASFESRTQEKHGEPWKLKERADRGDLFVFGSSHREFEGDQRRGEKQPGGHPEPKGKEGNGHTPEGALYEARAAGSQFF
ncbi:hypothetical protein BESB_009120 [Besnoitia besnoiti]|uniref:Kinetochore protein SPC25 n=1 Tax=Besnoitia besnoiti TaxID=94643 RepID=A0A2A9MQW0_BESBE|nr:hypothetical protein BESB_009120 [Besnoitia besnoiti]PFH38570.1 hypothetical protein BESB_009120 [Besnoitia besnoiti]